MEPTHILYECGICDSLHPWDWDGDCRDDENRFPDAQDYAAFVGVTELEIEVRTWQDRLDADANGE